MHFKHSVHCFTSLASILWVFNQCLKMFYKCFKNVSKSFVCIEVITATWALGGLVWNSNKMLNIFNILHAITTCLVFSLLLNWTERRIFSHGLIDGWAEFNNFHNFHITTGHWDTTNGHLSSEPWPGLVSSEPRHTSSDIIIFLTHISKLGNYWLFV